MSESIPNIEIEKIVKHWLSTSEEDYKTMLSLYESKSFHWSLFLGHVCVEKMLKALYVKVHKQHAPYIHNLFRLAELCDIKISAEYSDWLDEMTSFNINARYNDYKKEFYNQCTPEFTLMWIERIRLIRSWINQKL
jgi:HEPN domain-containing protein